MHGKKSFVLVFWSVRMKKLVLDLDETLIYSAMEPLDDDFIKLSAAGQTFYTKLRPGAKEFLEYVKRKFDVTIWTTGHQAYLESIWAYLDMPGFTLWGRDYCKRIQNPDKDCIEPYEKPLRQIIDDLTQIVIVDNTPSIFAKYPLNGILSRTWRGEMDDTELTHLSYYLGWLEKQPSMQRDHQAWRLETLCIRSK
jgi:TFIIF-interacting CTD phosphatase-like protein